MKALLFVPDFDSPGKKDVSGAFLPAARAFAKQYDLAPEDVIKRFAGGVPLDQRRATCSLAIRAVDAPLDVLAFFCHGWKGGLQAGFLLQHQLLLARLLAQYAKPTAHVLLYACDTARDADVDAVDDRTTGPGGDGGFADGLRDACEALGRQITVVGHATTGHCAENPFARRFAPNTGGQGGQWFIDPLHALWPLWRRSLADPRSSLRYRFWSMTTAQIEAELRGKPSNDPPLVA